VAGVKVKPWAPSLAQEREIVPKVSRHLGRLTITNIGNEIGSISTDPIDINQIIRKYQKDSTHIILTT
jgi:hypothetical protein